MMPLEAVINRAIKIMMFVPFGPADLKPIYRDLKLLDVKNVFKLETAKHMFKVKKEILPTDIGNYFEITNDYRLNIGRRYKMRTMDRPREITSRLVSSNRSMQIRGEKVWDQIPESLKSKNSLNVFKRHYKKFLLQI